MSRLRRRWEWILSLVIALVGAAVLCLEPAATTLSRVRASEPPPECDGVPYDPLTQGCCSGGINASVYDLATQQCCMGTDGTSVIPSDYSCCADGSNAPPTGGCCGGTAYDGSTTCCCDGENVSACPQQADDD